MYENRITFLRYCLSVKYPETRYLFPQTHDVINMKTKGNLKDPLMSSDVGTTKSKLTPLV